MSRTPEPGELYRQMRRIRRFEETVLEKFPNGVFYGTTHTYLGQEANAVGVLSCAQPDDIVVSNHRCHGHFLAYGGEPRALFAELMGRLTGVCGGRGGSQHLHWHNFYSNGVQGGTLPLATGMALAEKLRGSGAAAIVFMGDGTLGEGIVYESLNMASLWQAPVLYVVENNRIAQTTPASLAVAGDIVTRFRAFGIPCAELNSSDVLEILPEADRLLDEIHTVASPRALVLHTARFGPHSKGDDTRDPGEVETLRRTRDPLAIHGARLPEEQRTAIDAEVTEQIFLAFQLALADPAPDPHSLQGEYTA
jgi:acetoin:2,6-dichlorophenolindophenol oxidoreductase subunit alpha